MIIAVLSSCGPTAPTEAEVREKIIGEYCAGNYRLVLTDSTYRNRKMNQGMISSSMFAESCKGTYELVYENDAWVINFNKDNNPQGIMNCKKSYVVWNKEKEFVVGNEKKVIMWDLIDETALTKGACE